MKTSSSLLVLGLTGTLLFAPVGPASAQLDKCQKSVAKEVLKLQNKITKALNKCADSVQAQVQRDKPLADVGAKCDKQLDKAINANNPSSAISKAMATLKQLGPGGGATCSDSDLFSLGYLPENAFGDRWTRLAAIAAWQAGGETATYGNPSMSLDLGSLSLASPDCPLCRRAAFPPCFTQTCQLAAGSGGATSTVATSIPLALTGASSTGRCDVPTVMDPGEVALITGPSQGFLPIEIGGGIFACVTPVSSMGVANCGGGFPTVDTHACADHIVEDGVDECETAAPVQFCGNDSNDATHAGTVQGGACFTLTLGAPADGASFSVVRNRIQVLLPGEYGSDGLPCTSDDEPAALAGPFNNLNTTGAVSAQVIDPDNDDAAGDLTAGPTSGSPTAVCAVAAQGALSGLTTVNSFSALHSLLGADSVSETSLICE
ncbi:MAG: hypothetical protein E4H03_01375 [Myxococcales bacterium]|nr:MAG: hypothetical protein E4H03_01375 [Myxococcales bacterium]